MYSTTLFSPMGVSISNVQLSVIKYFVRKCCDIVRHVTIPWNDVVRNIDIGKYLLSIGININKFGKDLLTGCIQKNSPESAEFVVPFFQIRSLKI